MRVSEACRLQVAGSIAFGLLAAAALIGGAMAGLH
jgi:hypothetical protein